MKVLLSAALVLMLTGCAQQAFIVNNVPTGSPKEVTTQHFFIDGLGQKKTIDAAAVCGGSEKIIRTEVQSTFLNNILALVSFGIYTPREARVYCTK